MKNFIKSIFAAACCASLLASGMAQAHYLWLESGKAGASLYYGEVDAQLKEKSPGKLDRITAPQAYTNTADKAAPVELHRNANHLAIASGKAATVLALEESVAVADLSKSKSNLGMAKSNYYARLGLPLAAGATSPLALDITQGSKANSFILLYRGQPLKNAKLEVIAPNTWMQEHKTDAQGAVEINTPWRGQYIVHVLHIDRTAGEFSGQQYDNLRNHLTYTVTRRSGAHAGPVRPPKYVME